LLDRSEAAAVGAVPGEASAPILRSVRPPFLRIPPFPGARLKRFTELRASHAELADVIDEVTRLRVGGSYWAAQPKLPSQYVLVRCAAMLSFAKSLAANTEVVLWPVAASETAVPQALSITGECDPWHMLSSAAAVVLERDDELRLIAALMGVSAYVYDPDTGAVAREVADAREMLASAIGATSFEDPFTGEPMSVREAVELCGFWRQMIDSNRDIGSGIGFAFWKQDHVAPLLWSGSGAFRFLRSPAEATSGSSVAVWRAKAPQVALRKLERASVPLIEVEDGFLRSRGLGADCIPPLSITVDRLGAHFDPSQESGLERLLQRGEFDEQILERASELRQLIVEAGLGKYERAATAAERPAGERRHILVPGQVEDDRAVIAGGCGLVSNLDLLKRVRGEAPDAYIVYKPHPDVLAGHRRGTIPPRICLQYADQAVGQVPMGSLIDMVDEVHVNTSLAGFEALLRGKPVTTYGVPFYAGWGLTRDLGPVPARRSARRTIDELVAASLLIYPRYFDPITGLPCPAEVVVKRLTACDEREPGILVGMRRLQGKVMRRLRSLVQ
jgi:capsular polysaccharide export protein